MQSADPRKLDDATYRARLDGTRLRAVVGEALVRPIRVVVAEKFMKRPSQVGLVPDDHVVETVATSRPDPALAVWILPRRAVGRDHFLDSEVADALSQERAANGGGGGGGTGGTGGSDWVIRSDGSLWGPSSGPGSNYSPVTKNGTPVTKVKSAAVGLSSLCFAQDDGSVHCAARGAVAVDGAHCPPCKSWPP